jgi:putative two-component system response regulator
MGIMGHEVRAARILVIDDAPEAIDVICNLLPKEYTIQVALSGKKALEILKKSDNLPNLILLDVMMPEMDGYEVCRQINADNTISGIPVIFISAQSEHLDKVKAFKAGAVDYIVKPFQSEEVIVRVESHLKLYFLQKELENNNANLKEIVSEKVNAITELQMATIYALAKLAESRDGDTGAHIERVKSCCRLISKKLCLQPKFKDSISMEFMDSIEKSSPLHDIGKAGIKDSILLKKGKLTKEEFEEIKQHTSLGANTLKEVYKKYPGDNFLKNGIDIALNHHEKWDGSGYPNGLKGDEIPLSAQIVAIADVYDALREKRHYKDEFSHEMSHNIILQGLGNHFGPHIIDAFLACEQELDLLYT